MPELAGFRQPLAGEIAARRELLERLPFPVGYGVEIAMLIDALRAVGLERMAQVDLGTRQNRHQPLRDAQRDGARGARRRRAPRARRPRSRRPRPARCSCPATASSSCARSSLDERPPLAQVKAARRASA